MHGTNGEYEVTVSFTPRGISPSNASELRSVTFTLSGGYTPREKVYERAREEAVKQDVISEYGVNDHWDPYRVDVLTPETADGLVVGPKEF